METKIRILLADDHKVLRDGLRALLESEGDLAVVAEAGDVDAAVQLATKFLPDVIVMDLGMPGGSGLDAIRQIRQIELPVWIVATRSRRE